MKAITCPHCGIDAPVHELGFDTVVEPTFCPECGKRMHLGPLARLGRWWGGLFPSTKAFTAALLWLALAVILNLLTGCATPRIEYVDRPVPVEVERFVYVAIPDELLPEYTIATGPLEQCPLVGSERKLELEKARSNTRAIRAIRGTEVPPAK